MVHEVLRPTWAHDEGCLCVPCLKAVYAETLARAMACGRAYIALRGGFARPDELSRARNEWTQARQENILADHALRTAEDRDRFAGSADKADAALQWHPGGAL
jgi:hypothetical protein